MELIIYEEKGLEEALQGMVFSFQKECPVASAIANFRDYDKNLNIAKKLCKKDGGHNKFLEQIQVWMVVRASMDWWKQMDTYRVGVSKLSKSTMHTIMKKPIKQEDFHDLVDPEILSIVERYRKNGDFLAVSKNLPAGFLQTRMVNTNYKTLRNIIMQRKGHKLPDWELFTEEVLKQIENPELLGLNQKGEN